MIIDYSAAQKCMLTFSSWMYFQLTLLYTTAPFNPFFANTFVVENAKKK